MIGRVFILEHRGAINDGRWILAAGCGLSMIQTDLEPKSAPTKIIGFHPNLSRHTGDNLFRDRQPKTGSPFLALEGGVNGFELLEQFSHLILWNANASIHHEK